MSKARLAGVSYDDAAVAFDCDPRVMQQHYAAFDKATIADRVFGHIQNGKNGGGANGSANGNGASEKTVGVQMEMDRPRRTEMGARWGCRGLPTKKGLAPNRRKSLCCNSAGNRT